MPSLGADMDSAILREWKVKSGDQVQRGSIVAEVETMKGILDVEIFEDGIIEKLMVETNTEVPVGTVLAILHPEQEPIQVEPQVRTPAPIQQIPPAQPYPPSLSRQLKSKNSMAIGERINFSLQPIFM